MRIERHLKQRKLRDLLTHPAAFGAMGAFGLFLIFGPVMYMRAVSLEKFDPSIDAAVAESRPATEASPKPALDAAPAEKAAAPSPAHETELIAFYANWGDEGYKSLEKNIDEIDVLMPMWYHVDSKGRVTVDDPKHQAKVMRLIRERRPDMKVMPIVNNYDKPTESWNAPAVSKMIADPKKRVIIAKRIVHAMKRDGFDGVNIDFESFEPKDRNNLVAFMAELYPLAKKSDLVVSMDVIVGSKTYAHSRLAKHVDYMVPMMYDEHWKTSGPGPIASQAWYERTLKRFIEQVPAKKVVVAIGTYSYDWGRPGQRAKSLSWADAAWRARSNDKSIKLNAQGMNSMYAYKSGGTTRKVWMLDSVSAFNQVQAAYRHKVRGYAVWRLGAEDPALWKVLPNRDQLDGGVAASLEAKGRTIRFDEASGMITGASLKF